MHNQKLPDFYSALPSVIKMSGKPLLGLSKNKKRIALVAQGGGQRGIFTAGVLDSFIHEGFDPFELYFGTSAGALNLCSYLARNYGFAYRFITQFTTRSEFFNLIKYVRRRQTIGLHWAMEAVDLSNPKVLIDKAQQVLKNRQAYACATDATTLLPHFLPMFQDNLIDVLKASSAIPILYGDPVDINGRKFIDGGVSAAIPAKEAFNRGADIIIVIRTEMMAEDKKPVSSQFLENLRINVEKHLPAYLSKFNLENQLDKLSKYHALLSSRLQNLHNKYAEETWAQIKGKMPNKVLINGGRWLFGGDSIYRLQMLSGQKISLDMVDLLTRHYQTYQENIRFLQEPPARVQIIQISPSEPLSSSPLLSKVSDLTQDYYNGVAIGNTFLKQLGHWLNTITNID